MRVVRTLVDSVVEAGVSRSSLLGAAKLEPACLQTPDARYPRAKLFELCELALELTGDPAFGLHSVESLTDDAAFDPISGVVARATSLREAISSIQEFRGLLGDDASFRVYEDGGKVIVQANSLLDESLRVRRFIAELSLVGLFRTIRRFGVRGEADVDYVAFEYGPPEYREEYTRVFEGHARFDQKFTGICFDQQLMAARTPHTGSELHEAIRVLAAGRTQPSARMSHAARVHQFLVSQPPPRDMSMQIAARALGTSVRTLRRHLTAEGKSYAELVQEALASIAKTCLLDERRSIVETALELGFADNTGFHRAFKRWTGLTPTEFRRQHAGIAKVQLTP
jgi:AraC-like DNA-binding protein